MYYSNDAVTLSRDCQAILIPAGDPVTLTAGSIVSVTQALGSSYTLYADGNLVRIAGRDADAIGYDAIPEPVASQEAASDGSVDEALIWAQLRTCYDPEIPVNIVDLGLVYDCGITPLEGAGNRVDIQMTLTAPGCGMGGVLVEDIRQKIATVPNVSEVDVALVFDPPWSYEMMSEAARLETGMY
jgi:probable FeS assembly SUF system protein SufT